MRTGFLRLATGVVSALAFAVMAGVIPPSSEATTASWRAMPPAPVAGRIDASVVWTGREMIVWGGVTRTASGQATARSDGAAYNPRSRRWRRIANSPARVLGGGGPTAAWTGSRMVDYVGNSPDGPAATAAYDPRTNTWKRLATGALRVREQYASVWTGQELLMFGGHSGDAAATPTAAGLNPATGNWRELKALDAIAGLAVVNGAVWDGRQAIVAGQLYRASHQFRGPILFTFDPKWPLTQIRSHSRHAAVSACPCRPDPGPASGPVALPGEPQPAPCPVPLSADRPPSPMLCDESARGRPASTAIISGER